MKLQLHQNYLNSLEQMMAGQPEQVLSHIRGLRSQEVISYEHIMEQKILSFRLALKNNDTLPDVEELDAHKIMSPDLRAETFYVRGMYFMHLAEYEKAEQAFTNADLCYEFYDNHEKSLFSQFNLLMARCSRCEDDLSTEFSDLLGKAIIHGFTRVQAACLRQLSYIHFDHRRYNKAEQAAQRAVALYEGLSALSDLHLCLVQLADSLFETGQIRSAIQALEKIQAPLDKRAQFPLAYIRSKIFSEKVEISSFESINPYWLKRHRQFANFAVVNQNLEKAPDSWVLKKSTGLLYNPAGTLMGKVKTQSLEGQLLRALASGSLSRHALCEILWPQYAEEANIDDRFYRLVSRLKYKIGEYIVFDGKKYHLTSPLRIK